jgi:hypothetical protein
MSYFTYEDATISRTIYENPAKFPKVTFCNINWFTTEYAFNLTQTDVKWVTIKNFSDEQKQLLGHELEDILIECYFNFKPCNSTDFTWSFDEEYGNCYAFNTEANAKGMSISGSEFGLQLTLYVNIYEELLNDTNGNVKGMGALIRIENNSYANDYTNKEILLVPGMETFIEVEREFKSMLPKPYSECEITSDTVIDKSRLELDFYNLITQSTYPYSQHLCFSHCLQR